MASPQTFNHESCTQGTTRVKAHFAVGASGAIGAFTADSGQIDTVNIVRLSAGLYKVPLLEQWMNLDESHPDQIGPSSTTSGTEAQTVQDNVHKQSNRTFLANGSTDAVVASTKTWTLANGAFTASDVGAAFVVTNSTADNGTYTIASVTSSTVVVVNETVPANETFGATVTFVLTDVPYISVQFVRQDTGAPADITSGSSCRLNFDLQWDVFQ
jgi:hypothetical protein